MFARSVIRRQTYSDVMAKTAAHTVNGSGEGSAAAAGVFGAVAGSVCMIFALNQSTPSTQRTAPYYSRFVGGPSKQ